MAHLQNISLKLSSVSKSFENLKVKTGKVRSKGQNHSQKCKRFLKVKVFWIICLICSCLSYFLLIIKFLTSNFQSLTHSLILFVFFLCVCLGVIYLVWGCNASSLGNFVKLAAINCFWKILLVLRRTDCRQVQ